MLNANDARKNAVDNKNITTEIDSLTNHFEQLIKRASNSGKFAIDKVVFPQDRFKEYTVSEVVKKLTENGYKVELTKNNAHQQLIFNISW